MSFFSHSSFLPSDDKVIAMADAQDRASFNLLAHMVKEEPMEGMNATDSSAITMPTAASFLSLLDISKDEEDMDMDR